MKDLKIIILRIHMMKKTPKIPKTRKNHPLKKPIWSQLRKKENNNQTFNVIVFPKKGYSFYIDKYVVFWCKNDWSKGIIYEN